MNQDNKLEEFSNYTDYWRELTETICKLVQLTRPITVQHQNQRAQNGKDSTWPLIDQLKKVPEECLEIMQADARNDQENFNEENLDLLFATLTTLHISNLTDNQIKFAVGLCLAKFHKRGWLKF